MPLNLRKEHPRKQVRQRVIEPVRKSIRNEDRKLHRRAKRVYLSKLTPHLVAKQGLAKFGQAHAAKAKTSRREHLPSSYLPGNNAMDKRAMKP